MSSPRWCTQIRDFGLQHICGMRNLHILSVAGRIVILVLVIVIVIFIVIVIGIFVVIAIVIFVVKTFTVSHFLEISTFSHHCNAQCVHCTVGFPCSKNSPVLATGEFLNPHC